MSPLKYGIIRFWPYKGLSFGNLKECVSLGWNSAIAGIWGDQEITCLHWYHSLNTLLLVLRWSLFVIQSISGIFADNSLA